MVQEPLVDQILLIIEDSRSHSDIPQSVGILWTSDQPDAENATSQNTTFITHRDPRKLWDSNPSFPASERLQTHALDRAATVIGPRIIDHDIIPSVTLRNYLNNELILTLSHEGFPATSGPFHHSQPLHHLTPFYSHSTL